jgi:hypothetical protein
VRKGLREALNARNIKFQLARLSFTFFPTFPFFSYASIVLSFVIISPLFPNSKFKIVLLLLLVCFFFFFLDFFSFFPTFANVFFQLFFSTQRFGRNNKFSVEIIDTSPVLMDINK